jgi:hypothetical protein
VTGRVGLDGKPEKEARAASVEPLVSSADKTRSLTVAFPRICLMQNVEDSGFRIQDSGFRIQDSGFRIQDSRFRIQDSGLNLFFYFES